MKYFLYIFFLGAVIYSCSTTRDRQLQDPQATVAENDTVRIANDSLEYEIIIIDPGFSYFLNAVARPEGYHSQFYLEDKNKFLVTDYNLRVRQPQRYNPNIYEMEINYDPKIDYGYEVNYKLYNYFVYLSHKYNQRFSVPTRI